MATSSTVSTASTVASICTTTNVMWNPQILFSWDHSDPLFLLNLAWQALHIVLQMCWRKLVPLFCPCSNVSVDWAGKPNQSRMQNPILLTLVLSICHLQNYGVKTQGNLMGQEIPSSHWWDRKFYPLVLHPHLPQKDTSRCSLPASQKDIYLQASCRKDIYLQIIWLCICYINPNTFQAQTFLAVLWPLAANLFSYQLFNRDASRIDVFVYYHWVLFSWPLWAPCHLLQNCNAIGIRTPRLAPWTDWLTLAQPQSLHTQWHCFCLPCHLSDALKDCVSKLEFSVTGPWRVISSADSGSYNIEHCRHPTRGTKKHATDLTPYPAEPIPFEPVNGPTALIPSIANFTRPLTPINSKKKVSQAFFLRNH